MTHRKRFLKTHREKREKMLTHRKRYLNTHRDTERICWHIERDTQRHGQRAQM